MAFVLGFIWLCFLLGFRGVFGWPVVGGCFSLGCMAASLAVLQRWLGWEPYLIWAVLCVPGALFVIAGWKLGQAVRGNSSRGA